MLPIPVTVAQNATRFALFCLTSLQAAGIFYNPYLPDLGYTGTPSFRRSLELFTNLAFELGMLPDLRPGWSYSSPMPDICRLYSVDPSDVPAFLTAFKRALSSMLPEGEWLGCEI